MQTWVRIPPDQSDWAHTSENQLIYGRQVGTMSEYRGAHIEFDLITPISEVFLATVLT